MSSSPEGHRGHDQVHADGVGDRQRLALVLGADLAGLVQPLVAEERVRRHGVCSFVSVVVGLVGDAPSPPEPSGRRNPTRLAGRLPVRDRPHSSPALSPIPPPATPAARWSCTGSPATPSRCAGWPWPWPTPGFTVELPLLPGPRHRHRGHGARPAGRTGRPRPRRPTPSWRPAATRSSWSGLSMGGTLSVWLAEHHPEIAAFVAGEPARRRRPMRTPSASSRR